MQSPPSAQSIIDSFSRDSLQHAIWTQSDSLFTEYPEAAITEVAKNLSWEDFDFPPHDSDRRSRRTVVPIESVNGVVLSAIGIDGSVYQICDKIGAELTSDKSRSLYGPKKRRVERQITSINRRHLRLRPSVTYSNYSRVTYTVNPAKKDIDTISRGNLSDYRSRFRDSPAPNVPEEVGGWQLEKVEKRDALKPDGNTEDWITKIRYTNGDRERSNITAHWRSPMNCWSIRVPSDTKRGVLSSKNFNKYLYEIDYNHNVITTRDALNLVKEAANKLHPGNYQSPFDLRSADRETPSSGHHSFVPIPLTSIGDWALRKRTSSWVKWANTNPHSQWHDFTVELRSTGSVTVRNLDPGPGEDETEEEYRQKKPALKKTIHDSRRTSPNLPSGKPDPRCVDGVDRIGTKLRERFLYHWPYAISFLLDTTEEEPPRQVTDKLTAHAPERKPINEFDHGLSLNPFKESNRDQATLSSF
jgi:hypothetical protein